MAKRLTDTEKWRDEWFGSLSNDYRIVWLYLIDSCTHAGVWKKDFRGLNFNCNTTLSEAQVLEVFGSRLVDCGNFFFIPKFIKFQYSQGLGSNKPVIVSVVKELKSNNLLETIKKQFGNDYLIIKDKSKDKSNDKDKSKSKDKSMDTEKAEPKQKPPHPAVIEVIQYLNELNGTNFRTDTKATVKLIEQRFAEGFPVSELKEIIEYKVAEWKGTANDKWLQPDTLFNGENCAKYRNQVQAAKDKKMSITQIRSKTSNAPKTRDEMMEEFRAAQAKKYATQ